MVSYQPVLHPTAERELNSLDDSERNRLVDVLHEVAGTKEPTKHEKCKILEGQRGLFRVRVGDVRAVCRLNKPKLIIGKVGMRKEVYTDIDRVCEDRLPNIRA